MAILWTESFDTQADDEDKLKIRYSSQTLQFATLSATYAQTGTYGLDFGGTTPIYALVTPGGTAPYTIIFTAKFYWQGENGYLFQVCDSSVSTGWQATLSSVSDGSVTMNRGFSTVIDTSATGKLKNGWNTVEWKVTIDNSGSYVVKINNEEVLNDTGDTQNQSTNGVAAIGFGSNGATAIDDLVVMDSTGTTNNDFLGAVKIYPLRPSGNGTTSGFTGSDGNSTDNYLLVDETAWDGDTTYVAAGSATLKDTYAFENLLVTPSTVYGVVVHLMATKTDSASVGVKPVVRVSLTDYDGTEQMVTTSYAWYQQIYDKTPERSPAAWTASSVNALEVGAKRST